MTQTLTRPSLQTQHMAPWPGNIIAREPIANLVQPHSYPDNVSLYGEIQDIKHDRKDYRLFSLDMETGMVVYYDEYESDESSEQDADDDYEYWHDMSA